MVFRREHLPETQRFVCADPHQAISSSLTGCSEDRALGKPESRRFSMIVRRVGGIVAAVLALGLPAGPAMAEPVVNGEINRCVGQVLKDVGGASNLPEGQLLAYRESCQTARHLRF
jgi:hypothetical protein